MKRDLTDSSRPARDAGGRLPALRLALAGMLLLLCFHARAQGSLQYNRVLLVSASQTVPAGRVWKVESIGCNQETEQNIGISGPRIVVNGTNIFLTDRVGMPTSSNAFFPSMLPMWLPAGATLAAGTGVQWVSVLEFLVSP